MTDPKDYTPYNLPPTVEEFMKQVRGDRARNVQEPQQEQRELPLPELLKQLSKYVSKENLERLMEEPKPNNEERAGIIEINCPILEDYHCNFKIKGSSRVQLTPNGVSCKLYFVEYGERRCKGGDIGQKCPY